MKLLVIRFSSMGDLAMTVPVLLSLKKQYPDSDITIITKKPFAAIFENCPGISVYAVDTQGPHAGVIGIWRLRSWIREQNFDVIIDLHGSLRSKLIARGLKEIKIEKIKKDRKVREDRIRHIQDMPETIPHRIKEYVDTFQRAGITVKVDHKLQAWLDPQENGKIKNFLEAAHGQSGANGVRWIGFSPFAKHKTKQWPEANTFKFLKQISESMDSIQLILFCGSGVERLTAENWKQKYPFIHLVPKDFSLSDEIEIWKSMEMGVVTDSANMHLASIAGTRVLSLWGATHPDLGFLGWGQSLGDVIQVAENQLPCRPCSVFGNRGCRRGDYACMDRLNSSLVHGKMSEILQEASR